ncbi:MULTISPECIES: DUF3107 domain-containing protein [Dermacoccus]|jgi:hypothetical protein|uniref:DUF3107 domain-containing protein n=3 Tax=Dermacoccus TaxID=57495 RepID=A0A417ZBE2_9MICO|nr:MULTISPECIES: DUF3107 domain-containing protein [Dermacoccus]QNK52612.1 DUF3107 domain-containing protein [Dermacoccus sp. PAMC28757]RHW47955.1 DUF3107 domain-containing protein [Dermacoccus abyssi]
MEVRIGVQNVAREIVIESNESSQAVREAVAAALSAGTPLTLTDEKGHSVTVPATALAYVDIAAEQKGRVGFGG